MGRDFIIPFGKYKGQEVYKVRDTDYLHWLLPRITNLELAKQISEQISYIESKPKTNNKSAVIYRPAGHGKKRKNKYDK